MSWFGWAYQQDDADGFSQLREAQDIPLIESGIQQILNTVPGERRMEPEFGSRVKYLVFDPHDDILYTEIGREVIRAVERWEPRVFVRDVQVVADDRNDHCVRCFVVWQLRNNQRISARTEVVVNGDRR